MTLTIQWAPPLYPPCRPVEVRSVSLTTSERLFAMDFGDGTAYLCRMWRGGKCPRHSTTRPWKQATWESTSRWPFRWPWGAP